MARRMKLWSSLSVITLVGTGVLAGCDGGSEQAGSVAQPEQQMETRAQEESAQPAVVSGTEGEGEGEGEGATGANPATDNSAFLAQLGFIRGHLLVGVELFRAGHIDHARTHMKHPEDELCAALKPVLVLRGIEPFDAELLALADAVENGGDAAQVEAAYEGLLAAIERAEASTNATPLEWLMVAVDLVRTAGVEYGIAVQDDGTVVNAHEYQDAMGFVKTADRIVTELEGRNDEQLAEVLAQVRPLIEELYVAWPGLMPPEQVDARAYQLHGAAARVELAAMRLR